MWLNYLSQKMGIVIQQLVFCRLATVYIQIFKECNFRGFRSELVIREIFILKISLANLDLHESESRILGDPRK